MVQVTGPIRRNARAVEPTWREHERRRTPAERLVWISLLGGVFALLLVGGTIYYATHALRWMVAFLIAGGSSLGLGAFLGQSIWPKFGTRFAGALLRLYAFAGRRHNAQLLLTPYPDFVPSRARQWWESTAFAGALALLMGVNFLVVFVAPAYSLVWYSLSMLALCCMMTFLLVPHWAFARLGIRLSEQGRFVVRSVGESYSRWVRVSNGTLLVGAVAYGAAVIAGRAARVEGYLMVAATLVTLLFFAALVMLMATACFRRHEELVLRRIMLRARRVGFIPVRGGRVASV